LVSGYQTSKGIARHNRGVEADVEQLANATAINQVWVSRLALGMDPQALIRLSNIVGSHPRGDPPKVIRYQDDPTADDVLWALGRVTEVVYRLWAGGLLDLSAWEQQIQRSIESKEPSPT
jgi:hypothetical protein